MFPAFVVTLAACEPTDQPDPFAQCMTLVVPLCHAALECGWDDNATPCIQHFAEACERNRTVVPEHVISEALTDLATFECAEDESFITFSDERGRFLLDIMTTWPEE